MDTKSSNDIMTILLIGVIISFGVRMGYMMKANNQQQQRVSQASVQPSRGTLNFGFNDFKF